MIIFPIDPELVEYLRNPFYPGLGTELLEPRSMKLWSFRIDRKYRVIFIFQNPTIVEIIDINNHYK